VIYPPINVDNGVDVIVLEDHVTVSGGMYRITANVVGFYTSIVAYGGSSAEGNITAGVAAINYAGYKVVLLGFASTRNSIFYNSSAVLVNLNLDGGYVIYKSLSLAVYYRRISTYVGLNTVNIWIPAQSLPSTLAPAEVHVVVNPVRGTYIIGGAEYVFSLLTPPPKQRGVLLTWAVAADRSGTYSLRINP